MNNNCENENKESGPNFDKFVKEQIGLLFSSKNKFNQQALYPTFFASGIIILSFVFFEEISLKSVMSSTIFVIFSICAVLILVGLLKIKRIAILFFILLMIFIYLEIYIENYASTQTMYAITIIIIVISLFLIYNKIIGKKKLQGSKKRIWKLIIFIAICIIIVYGSVELLEKNLFLVFNMCLLTPILICLFYLFFKVTMLQKAFFIIEKKDNTSYEMQYITKKYKLWKEHIEINGNENISYKMFCTDVENKIYNKYWKLKNHSLEFPEVISIVIALIPIITPLIQYFIKKIKLIHRRIIL